LKIKVCGITTPEDALTCVAAGVDWVGLNFHPGSPRFLDPARAVAIRTSLQGRAEAVGLFVDRPAAEITEIARSVGLDIVQLHGSEPVESLTLLEGLRVIKAFRLAGSDSAAEIREYIERAETLGHPLYAILVDAHVLGLLGGTGVEIPDDLLGLIPAHPRMILAGGLTPENVADRVARVLPWMVDVASGVESAPGRKCPARIERFVAEARRDRPGSTFTRP
jgi:phosphoribosylanthranilate isomerase